MTTKDRAFSLARNASEPAQRSTVDGSRPWNRGGIARDRQMLTNLDVLFQLAAIASGKTELHKRITVISDILVGYCPESREYLTMYKVSLCVSTLKNS